MLTDLLKISKRVLVTTHNSGHATQSRALELLAAVQTVTELDQTNIVLGHLLDQVTSRIDLTECQLIMVFVVKDTGG